MKVGIIGSGEVGQSLGKGFAATGHDVMIGSRSPHSESLKAWKLAAGAHASTGTFSQAAEHGELLVLAVKGDVTESAIDLAGHPHFAGKLLIDATNPLDFSKGMPPGLFVGTTDSLAERVQRKLPKSKVVKAFNTVPNPLMFRPKLPGGPPDMMICGDDAAAKKQVTEILSTFGWAGAIDLGTLDAARWLEALVPLWVRAGVALGTFNHAFKILHE